jgi:predicted NBD/HSP70 family sugar kinase
MPRAPAARPDAIRRHNLGLLLGQVHHDGELTRAELTQRLSLSRSTIGALVADLTELGLLDERVPNGGERAGRPSHVVGPRPDGPYAIAVDIDVTHLTIAAVGIGGHVLSRHTLAMEQTPSPPDVVARFIVAEAADIGDHVGAGAWPVGIGVSVPGTVDRHSGTVEFAPNLTWRHEEFGAMLAALAPPELPVVVGNDADLAVIAEHLRGSGRDCDDVVYLIGRIGVGAGIIANGAPLRGHAGHAGEVGHNVVDVSGPPCHCGKRGCVETYVGESALLQLAGRIEPVSAESVAAVFADAAAGEERAASAVRAVAEALGRTIAGLVNVLNPERVLLGGSFAEVNRQAGDDVMRALETHTMATSPTAVQLCSAGLGDDSSLLGAAEMAFSALLADPLLSSR